MKKIVYVTGTRADYGLMKTVFKAIANQPQLSLKLVVVGMHLQEQHGTTIQDIENDGFSVLARIKPLSVNTSENVGHYITEMSRIFAKDRPDILLIEADRGEALAGTIVGAYMNIPVVHTSGGMLSGSVDDSVRHAITKLAHYHLPATPQDAKRILAMGEEPWRVRVVGIPMNTSSKKTKNDVEQFLNLNLDVPTILVVQHSFGAQADDAEKQMQQTMDAIKKLGLQTIVVYPNNDEGNEQIRAVIEQHKNLPFVYIYKNIPSDFFMALLKNVQVLVGNSSSGIVEAPFFKLPVVNIGTRQQGRDRSNNVIDVPHDSDAIFQAVKKALSNEFRSKINKNPYSTGKNVEEEIVDFLLHLDITQKTFDKKTLL